MRATRAAQMNKKGVPTIDPREREARDQFEQEHRVFLADVQAIFNTPQGQNVLRYLTRHFADAQLVGPTPEETGRRIGLRDMVIMLRDWSGPREE